MTLREAGSVKIDTNEPVDVYLEPDVNNAGVCVMLGGQDITNATREVRILPHGALAYVSVFPANENGERMATLDETRESVLTETLLVRAIRGRWGARIGRRGKPAREAPLARPASRLFRVGR